MQTHSHQGPEPNTRLHTLNANIHNMFGLWDLQSNTWFFIKITFAYCVFSAPDVASGICVHLSLFKVLSVSIYCSVPPPPHTSTNAEGQRLNRPKGSVRCSDSCRGLLCLLCMCERVCEDSDIISLDSGVTDWWGHWLTPERDSVSADSKMGRLCKEKFTRRKTEYRESLRS